MSAGAPEPAVQGANAAALSDQTRATMASANAAANATEAAQRLVEEIRAKIEGNS